jgi:hypothetical protein
MKKLFVATLLAVVTTSANAWGPRETAALLGFIGGAVVMGAANNAQAQPHRHPAPVPYSPVPVYTQPPVTYYHYRQPIEVCRDIHYYDNYGRISRIMRVCNYR